MNKLDIKEKQNNQKIKSLKEFADKIYSKFYEEITSRLCIYLECEENSGQYPSAKISYTCEDLIYTDTFQGYDNLTELRNSWEEDACNNLMNYLINHCYYNHTEKKIHIKPRKIY